MNRFEISPARIVAGVAIGILLVAVIARVLG